MIQTHFVCDISQPRRPTQIFSDVYKEKSLIKKKNVWCIKIKKTTFICAIIHHHLILWFSPFVLTAILSDIILD